MKKATIYFIILSVLAGGVFTYSTQKAFSGYTTNAIVSNVRVENITETNVKILWDTNMLVDTSKVHYGTDPGVALTNGTLYSNLKCSTNSGSVEMANCIELPNLSPATTYYYRVKVYKTGGNWVRSDEYSFTTLAPVTPGGTTTGGDSTTQGEPTVNISNNEPAVNTEGNIALIRSNLSGSVISPLGNVVANAVVKVFSENYSFSTHGKTDSLGQYRIDNIPAGTYFARVFVPTKDSFVAPNKKEIVLLEGEEKTLDFVLRRAGVSISGMALIGTKSVPNAFVWGWSENGAYRSTTSTFDGSFRMLVPQSDIWHMGASVELDGILYRIKGVKIEIDTTSVWQDLYLERAYKFTMLEKEKTSDAATEITVTHEDGAEVKAEGGAISTTGTIQVNIRPDIQIPTQEKRKRAVGIAYNMEARDTLGNLITTFQKPVTVKLPYKDGDVVALGGTEDNLTLHYWDEVAETWIKIENSVVDKLNNFVSADVSHFTRFALLVVVPETDTSGIVDGDLIKTASSPDVYITKIIGTKKFKRLILNPQIFDSYGHLKWGNIKSVTQSQMDTFFLSELTLEVYSDGTPVNGKVYLISSSPNSDIGTSRRLDITPAVFEKKGFDWEGIFYINHIEASPNFYPEEVPITS